MSAIYAPVLCHFETLFWYSIFFDTARAVTWHNILILQLTLRFQKLLNFGFASCHNSNNHTRLRLEGFFQGFFQLFALSLRIAFYCGIFEESTKFFHVVSKTIWELGSFSKICTRTLYGINFTLLIKLSDCKAACKAVCKLKVMSRTLYCITGFV